MKVYVVISEFDGVRIVEKVYQEEQDAINFCYMMNHESIGYYDYTEQILR